jgi:hypothetical protein
MLKMATRLIGLLVAFVLVPQSVTLASGITYPLVPFELPPTILYTFDFAAFPSGTPAPFSETLGPVTGGIDPMTITYAGTPGIFVVGSSGLESKLLPDATLSIGLSSKVYGIGVQYKMVDPSPLDQIYMDFFGDGKHLGSFASDFPEGFLGFIPLCVCPNEFDGIVLHADSPFFSISEVVVVQNVPEPFNVALLATGFGGLALLSRRCHRRHADSAAAMKASIH